MIEDKLPWQADKAMNEVFWTFVMVVIAVHAHG